MKKLLALCLLLCLLSCGGTWENDAIVWEKNFGEEKPEDIDLLNSYYWKSSHWTYESISYMEIAYSRIWLQKMIADFELKPIVTISEEEFSFDIKKPIWFVPKTKENYVLLKSSSIPELKLYIDKESNRIFYTYIQL